MESLLSLCSERGRNSVGLTRIGGQGHRQGFFQVCSDFLCFLPQLLTSIAEEGVVPENSLLVLGDCKVRSSRVLLLLMKVVSGRIRRLASLGPTGCFKGTPLLPPPSSPSSFSQCPHYLNDITSRHGSWWGGEGGRKQAVMSTDAVQGVPAEHGESEGGKLEEDEDGDEEIHDMLVYRLPSKICKRRRIRGAEAGRDEQAEGWTCMHLGSGLTMVLLFMK
eukprot:170344-Hanusia_phi.AAC.11